MSEVLTQDEIDRLLVAISDDEDSSNDYDNKLLGDRKIKVYDFKRPDKFSKDHIRTVSMMHESFSRLTTTSLSAQLRTLVQVHVASVDQLTYEEFIRSIPQSTTLAIIQMDPLKGQSILEMDPSITFSIIDRLFGGTGDAPTVTRELTDIEQSVMEGIILRILGNMREAWSQVIDLRPRLGQIETNAQFAQIVPPNEMVILVTLETKVGDVEGMINFCIPYLTLEPIVTKLSAQFWYAVRRGGSVENISIIQQCLNEIYVDLIAEIGCINLTIGEVLSLNVGDVIRLPNVRIESDLMLKIGDRVKFKCIPGLMGKNISVKITEKIAKIEYDEFENFEMNDY